MSPPDLLVGVDFGMTYTGVSYAKPNMDSPRIIQDWPRPPGKHGLHNKVPSTIRYGAKNQVEGWGFKATSDHQNTIDWFKRYLDKKYLTRMLDIAERVRVSNGQDLLKLPFKTVKEARRVYGDYMRCLYRHIEAKLTNNQSWKDKSVEFIFSLPATFRSLDISNALMEEIVKAGFGSGGRNHRVSWGLTEPQAAAVYTAKEVNITLDKGDIILVCDAGGGTTDLALLQQHGDESASDLRELQIIQGKDIGSTNIDTSFYNMVQTRLAKVSGGLKFAKNAAWTMMHSDEFQTWKHEFGRTDESQFSIVRITVPISIDSPSISDHAAGISDGKMNFSHKDFQALFDPEVNGIIEFIQEMIQKARSTNQVPNYLVLSGGLGSSAYLQQKVRRALSHLPIAVVEADEPQLSVAKGLILDRKQQHKTGRAALSVRKARASYGVITSERYEPGSPRHRGLVPTPSTIDKTRVVHGLIKWVIKKGDSIDTTEGGKTHSFRKRFRGKENAGVSENRLVVCHADDDRTGNDGEQLPVRVNDPRVHPLCTVRSDLSRVDKQHVEEKALDWAILSSRRRKYFEIPYDVKFVVGPSDASFQLWVGEKEYAGENSFKVAWDDEGLRS